MKVVSKAKHRPKLISDLLGGQVVRWGMSPDPGGLYWLVGGVHHAEGPPARMLYSLDDGSAGYVRNTDTLDLHEIDLVNMTVVEDYEGRE